MFRKRDDADLDPIETSTQADRITSVLGDGTQYNGRLTGEGGVRIEGTFEGEIQLNGLLVVNVPLSVVQGHELALAGALDFLYGAGAANFVVFAALFILLSHQNIQYMAASRVLHALSVDGLGSRRATRVSERGTPTGAVALSWLLMGSLIVAGGFEFLLNLCALLFMVGYIALVLGVFRMRHRAPERERPYRAWGYPWSGLVCAVGWIAIAVFVALMDPRSALYSIGLAAGSVPVFLWLKRRRAPAASLP